MNKTNNVCSNCFGCFPAADGSNCASLRCTNFLCTSCSSLNKCYFCEICTNSQRKIVGLSPVVFKKIDIKPPQKTYNMNEYSDDINYFQSNSGRNSTTEVCSSCLNLLTPEDINMCVQSGCLGYICNDCFYGFKFKDGSKIHFCKAHSKIGKEELNGKSNNQSMIFDKKPSNVINESVSKNPMRNFVCGRCLIRFYGSDGEILCKKAQCTSEICKSCSLKAFEYCELHKAAEDKNLDNIKPIFDDFTAADDELHRDYNVSKPSGGKPNNEITISRICSECNGVSLNTFKCGGPQCGNYLCYGCKKELEENFGFYSADCPIHRDFNKIIKSADVKKCALCEDQNIIEKGSCGQSGCTQKFCETCYNFCFEKYKKVLCKDHMSQYDKNLAMNAADITTINTLTKAVIVAPPAPADNIKCKICNSVPVTGKNSGGGCGDCSAPICLHCKYNNFGICYECEHKKRLKIHGESILKKVECGLCGKIEHYPCGYPYGRNNTYPKKYEFGHECTKCNRIICTECLLTKCVRRSCPNGKCIDNNVNSPANNVVNSPAINTSINSSINSSINASINSSINAINNIAIPAEVNNLEKVNILLKENQKIIENEKKLSDEDFKIYTILTLHNIEKYLKNINDFILKQNKNTK